MLHVHFVLGTHGQFYMHTYTCAHTCVRTRTLIQVQVYKFGNFYQKFKLLAVPFNSLFCWYVE